MDSSLDYYKQQSFQSPQMEKTNYSMIKPHFQYLLTNTALQKVLEEKYNPRKLATTLKTWEIDNLNPKKHTHKHMDKQ